MHITVPMSGPQPSALYQTIQHNWGLWSRPTASPEERAKLNMLWWVAYKELGAPREKNGYYVFPLSFLVFAYYLLLRGAFTLSQMAWVLLRELLSLARPFEYGRLKYPRPTGQGP